MATESAPVEANKVLTKVALQPLGKFNFANPDGWLKWKRCFQQFMSASSLTNTKTSERLAPYYCLGDNADEVLTSTSITADERKLYEGVLAKLDEFFKVRRNIIYK